MSITTEKTLLFIPTYNCEPQIRRVLEKVGASSLNLISEILVIDNRSQDGTLESARNKAHSINKKITLLKNHENYNLGGSIKRAFQYALENDFDYMITLHGDDQANIQDVIPYLETGAHREADLLIGARFHSKSKLYGYSWIRIGGNLVLNTICSILTHRKIYDLIAGLNCYRVDFFKKRFYQNFPDNLTFDVHLLLYAISHKAKITYIPITWIEEDQISNAKVFRQTWIILKLFAAYLISPQILERNRSGRRPDFEYTSEIFYQK